MSFDGLMRGGGLLSEGKVRERFHQAERNWHFVCLVKDFEKFSNNRREERRDFNSKFGLKKQARVGKVRDAKKYEEQKNGKIQNGHRQHELKVF